MTDGPSGGDPAEPPPEDAVVEDVDDDGADETALEARVDPIHLPPIQEIEASAVRPVGESPVAKVRETVRTRVSYLIVGSTVILGFCLVGAYLWGAQNVKLAISGVFTPLLGVTGVIVGYYFGGKDHTAG